MFLLNHAAQEAKVQIDGDYRNALTGDVCAGSLTLAPFGVAVLQPL